MSALWSRAVACDMALPGIVATAAAGDLIGYVEAHRRFHLALLALAGNGHLVQVVGDLRKRSRLYGLTALWSSGACWKTPPRNTTNSWTRRRPGTRRRYGR